MKKMKMKKKKKCFGKRNEEKETRKAPGMRSMYSIYGQRNEIGGLLDAVE